MTGLAHASRMAVLGVTVCLLAAACGGSASGTGSSGKPSPTPTAGGRQGAIDPAQQAKVQQCLSAAGLSSSLPSGAPGGFPSGGPGGNFTPPPGGGPGPGAGTPPAGFGGGPSAAVQQALTACGIALPGPAATATP
ncbi:MAG: hypothetical protein M3O32_18985 [Actinomycetota bacterium]|nr:hypothetical protein [Actinomycetota bacterium]